MKKITLFILLLIVPFIASAQTWDFNTDLGGWESEAPVPPKNSSVAYTGTTATITYDNDDVYGKMLHTSANVLEANSMLTITLKNNSAENNTLITSFDKIGGGTNYPQTVITTSDATFQTYVIDLSALSGWAGGDHNAIQIFLKGPSNAAVSTAGTLEIDNIEFAAPPAPGPAVSFNFDSTNEGWTSDGAAQGTSDATTVPGFIYNTFAGDNVTSLNTTPGIIHAAVNVDADTHKYVHITLQNGSEMTNLNLRIVNGGSFTYRNQDISTLDGATVTYTFDMTGAAGWSGYVNDLFIYVKPDSSQNNANVGLSGAVLYDSIVIDSNPPVIPPTPPVVFSFDAGAEGWSVPVNQGALTTPAGSIVNTFTGSSTVPGIKNASLSIDADALKYCHITMTNNSAMTALVLRFTTGATPPNSYNTMAMTANASGVYTYDFSGLGLWKGTITNIDIYVKPDAGQNNSTLKLSGNLDFDQIVFSQDAVLAVEKVNFKEDANITLYPNPVSNILTINSPNRIEKMEVFNMLGQTSLSQNGVSKTLDASSLSNGMYILKIHQEGDIISTKRFIKQ